MAEDDIVQKVVIEVDDTALAKVGDTAATSFNKLETAAGTAGQSLRGMQDAAGQVGTGAAKLGVGLDQVAEKTVVTTRQMRAMGTVMRTVGEGAAASVATGFVRIGAALGPIGIALYAAAEAFSYVKGKMKEWEDQAKATIEAMAGIAKIAKEDAHTGPMPFTGGPAYDLPKAIDSAKAFVAALKDAGISVDDVTADTKKLGEAFYQASLVAAKLYEKMTPIEKADFEKVMKGIFPPETIASIEKGTAALKQARAEAEATSWENWAPAFRKIGDAIQSAAQAAGAFFASLAAPAGAFFQRLADAVDVSMAQVKDAIVGAFNAVLGPVKSVIDTIGGWIQGLINGVKALWSGLTGGGATVSAGGGGMAAGGEVGGAPGVDRNLAWLSRGEFVLNVAAVQKYGVGFLHAMNAMRAPRFALGGLNVGGSLPRTAGIIAGASSASPRVLNLTIEGRSFQGLTVPEHTATALERFAVHSQLASVGRKQSWRK